jgi:predicted DNA-binding transcriptional regulator AlpA
MVTQSPEVTDRILSTREVSQMTGLHPVSLWRHAKNRTFPLPLKITERKNGWRHSDIVAWLANRPHANYGTHAAA